MEIWEDTAIENGRTVVVIGPNGSGKTQYGIKLSKLNNADHIGALRNIALPENLPMKSFSQAEKEVNDRLKRRKSYYWELSNEIDILFGKLMADDAASAIRFRDSHVDKGTGILETTKIMELRKLWESIFPSRTISFEGYVPKVNSEYMHSQYAAKNMSDGERVALYLAARVLDSSSNHIIIDEPEVHFHSRLAVDFWNLLESLRPNKDFVYITHNLEFALSRNNPLFLIVKPNEKPIVIEQAKDIPKEIALDLLAAASLSIFAKHIVFCEGTKDDSIDYKIFSAWFNDKETVILPMNSCKNVIEAVFAYKKTDIIQNAKVTGIIDRDYASSKAIDVIKDDVFVLPFHEIESIIMLEPIIRQILSRIGRSDEGEIIQDLKDNLSTCYNKDIINKTISERFKSEAEFLCSYKIRGLKANSDDLKQKTEHLAIVQQIEENLKQLYDRCVNEVSEALASDYIDAIKILPGKPLINYLCKKVGLSFENYISIVCELIREENRPVMATLQEFLPDI